MKTLVLVRHGKASHCHPDLEDIDRPLSHRGRKDSELIAERYQNLDMRTHAIISSPALRAKTTAKAFADWAVLPVEIDDRLYTSSVTELLDLVQEADDCYETVMLVGHNPGLSEFLQELTGREYPEMSPATVAVIQFDVPEWPDVTADGGTLEYYLDPSTPGEDSIAV